MKKKHHPCVLDENIVKSLNFIYITIIDISLTTYYLDNLNKEGRMILKESKLIVKWMDRGSGVESETISER